MSAEATLKKLGIELPSAPKPVGNYVGGVQVGNLLFMSGCGPRKPDNTSVTGKVGRGLSTEEGYEAARLVGLNMLANVKAQLGSLDRVKRVVKVLGMVNCVPGFEQTPQVMHGFSELLYEVFGERGVHARSAVGLQALPSNVPIEVETIFEIA